MAKWLEVYRRESPDTKSSARLTPVSPLACPGSPAARPAGARRRPGRAPGTCRGPVPAAGAGPGLPVLRTRPRRPCLRQRRSSPGPADAASRPDAPPPASVVIAAAGDIAGSDQPPPGDRRTLLMGLARPRAAGGPAGPGRPAVPSGRLRGLPRPLPPELGPAPRCARSPGRCPGNHEYDQGRSDASGYFDYFNGPGRSERAGRRARTRATTASTSATGTWSPSTAATAAAGSPAPRARPCTAG